MCKPEGCISARMNRIYSTTILPIRDKLFFYPKGCIVINRSTIGELYSVPLHRTRCGCARDRFRHGISLLHMQKAFPQKFSVKRLSISSSQFNNRNLYTISQLFFIICKRQIQNVSFIKVSCQSQFMMFQIVFYLI